jgi:hypothetical protein
MWRSSRVIVSSSQKGPPAAPLERAPWSTEEDRVVPVTIAWDRVLMDAPKVAGYVGGLRVYPSGFEVRITAVLRPDGSGLSDRKLEARLRLQPHLRPREPAATADEMARMFRVGVQFEDGRHAVADQGPYVFHPFSPDTALPAVRFGGGSWTRGGPAYTDLRVFGLPEEGSVTLFYQWLEFGVAESSVVIDGDALRAAAARAVVLWEHPPA